MRAQGAAPRGRTRGRGKIDGDATIIPPRHARIHRALARVGLAIEYRVVGGRWVVPVVTVARGAHERAPA
jgi:hypothetical protein